jgi:NAD(P)-dependent dehydrogenase (short-subunit alcohol dehydrogenase family)
MENPENGKILENQIALVTGGGRGIGQAIAQALAQAGATVVVVGRSEDQLAETTALIETAGGKATALTTDVVDRQAIAKVVEQIEQQFGSIDILVNNAGRHTALGPLWMTDPEEWWKDVEVNLLGTFLCMHAVLPGMVARRRGRIINISSAAGNQPRPHSTSYTTAKAAVTRLTESVALSTQEHNVSLFAVHPGSVRTAMADYLVNSEQGQKWVPDFRRIYDQTEIPAERAAQLAVLLASGKADKLTGRFLNVYDNIEELLEKAEDIQQQDLYTLRLHT